MSGGFKLANVGSATDAGFYGAGIYFSEQTAYSQAYDNAGGRLILCQLRVAPLAGLCEARSTAVRRLRVGCFALPWQQLHTAGAALFFKLLRSQWRLIV